MRIAYKIALVAVLTAVHVATMMGQAKKPTLMVVPGDEWCVRNGFMSAGPEGDVPDYETALLENGDLNLAISAINGLMVDRGFPLKDLGQSLKMVREESQLTEVTESRSGRHFAEGPIDKLMRKAKADIVLYLNWNVTSKGPKKTLTFSLMAKDAYTGKTVAGTEGTGEPSFAADISLLLYEAAVVNIDDFNYSLLNHFNDIFANGREVTLDIYGGNTYEDKIDEWIQSHSVSGRFSKTVSSDELLAYEQIRIPLYNESGIAIDTEGWVRPLRNILRGEPYNLRVRMQNWGLGKVILIIEDK